MSEAVKRLVARATGQAGSRLRPRLPSRFESAGSEDGDFVTEHAEVIAPRPRARSEARAAAPMRPEVEAVPAATLPPNDPVEPPHDRETPAPAKPPRSADGADPETADPPLPRPERTTDPKVEPATSTTPQDPKDGPVAAAAPTAVPPSATAPAGAASAAGRTEVRTVVSWRPPDGDPSAPPPPLMTETQAGPSDALAEPISESIAGPVRRASEPRQAPTEAGPPEITIHIGRIELRGEAARPAKRPRRSRPESNGTSLGDYLKGGGGRR